MHVGRRRLVVGLNLLMQMEFCASHALRANPATLIFLSLSGTRIRITSLCGSPRLPRVKARSHLMEGTQRAASGRRPFIGGAALADPPEPHGGECGRVSERAEPSLRTASRNLGALTSKRAMASVWLKLADI